MKNKRNLSLTLRSCIWMCVEWQKKNVLCNYLRAVKIGIHRRLSTLSLSLSLFSSLSLSSSWSWSSLTLTINLWWKRNEVGRESVLYWLFQLAKWMQIINEKMRQYFFYEAQYSNHILSYPIYMIFHGNVEGFSFSLSLSLSFIRTFHRSGGKCVYLHTHEPEWRTTLSHLTHRWRWPIFLSVEKWESFESIFCCLLLMLAAGNNLMLIGNKNSQIQTTKKKNLSKIVNFIFIIYSKARKNEEEKNSKSKKRISFHSLIRSCDCHVTSFFVTLLLTFIFARPTLTSSYSSESFGCEHFFFFLLSFVVFVNVGEQMF